MPASLKIDLRVFFVGFLCKNGKKSRKSAVFGVFYRLKNMLKKSVKYEKSRISAFYSIFLCFYKK